ncbi:MAG: CoA-binding protein [Bacteroidia bacterium]
MSKTTAIIGAVPNADRYSYKATRSLKQHGHKVYPIGMRAGTIDGEDILTDRPALNDVDTVTMYVGPQNQQYWTDYVLSLKPKRIIFNPGAEHPEFAALASSRGIECVEACTLVMLSIGNY